MICFELAYDQTVYDAVRGGAQVLMVQSNNATYGGTGQIEQQFAITRARAMEARREIAVATTNSVSGFIDRDGRVVAAHQRVHRRQHGGRRCRCAARSPRPSGSRRGWSAAWPRSAWSAGGGLGLRRALAGRASADGRPSRPVGRMRPSESTGRGQAQTGGSEPTSDELGSHPGHHPDLQRGREHRP